MIESAHVNQAAATEKEREKATFSLTTKSSTTMATTSLPRTALQRSFFSARPSPQCLSQRISFRVSQPTTRTFSKSSTMRYKTVEEAKSRYRFGPFSWQAGILFLSAGVGMAFYFRYEKERMARKRIAEHSKGVGRPLVGGPFQLIDQDRKPFTEQNLKGKYSLVYFGFTHCPDICPEELDKMAGMIDNVKEKHGDVMRPVFITCDPARDTPEVTKEYLKEFHEDLIGLTGEYDQVKATCKAFRVYFSTPQNVLPGQDYLVDHSIYFYLMGESHRHLHTWISANLEQTPRVTLSRPLAETLLSSRHQESSMTTSLTGRARLRSLPRLLHTCQKCTNSRRLVKHTVQYILYQERYTTLKYDHHARSMLALKNNLLSVTHHLKVVPRASNGRPPHSQTHHAF